MRTYLCIIICSFLTLSCSQTTEHKPYAINGEIQVTAATTIDYEFVRYYVLGTCAECHSTRVGPDLSTYETITQHIAEIQDELTEGAMPPPEDGYENLSNCQKEILTAWVNDGMPQKEGAVLSQPNSCF